MPGDTRCLGAHAFERDGFDLDKFPAGAWMNRALTLRTGQCHVQRYMRRCCGASSAARSIFKNKQDQCEKVVLKA
ncbi:hypothetical protein [Micromonospora sediminicola]|uniref:hypothetical protein n=1 Tax=Micromonospora sediminicola TaxID=946078 RepID=UPI0033E1E16D